MRSLKQQSIIMREKRAVVKQKKDILDINRRKLKVFQAIKPILIQQYRQDVIE